VVAALIVQSQRILLGQRSSTRTFYPGVWDVFGGHMEAGEQQHQTLVRELQEELSITPTQWKYLETIALPADEASEPVTIHLYLITAWTGTPSNRQVEEHSAIGWFFLAEVMQLPLADHRYPSLFARHLDPDPDA
jgi:8-oxo-dGTP diphosphatase